MKVFVVVSFIFILAAGAFAQQSGAVAGLVMVNDSPVADAVVTLKSKQNETRTTKSDAEGKYSFANVAAGEYEITGQLNRVTTRIITVGSGQVLTVDLDLKLDARRSYVSTINAFVTVSAGANQTIEQVSKTVDVIDLQQLRDRADFSLAETLRTIPGFRVQQLGGFGRTATIKTRGLRNQDTAILIDGIRFRDPSAITGDASPFLSDFTLTSVSKIEILRGSGSSLYGTNAVGGTVDFQTPRPVSGTHGQVSGALGGLGLGRFRANLSHGLENGKFGISGGVSRTAYTKGIDGQDNASNTNFQSRIEFNPFSKTNISGRFFVSDAKVRLNSSPDTFGILPATNATIINANQGVNFLADPNDPDNSQKSKFFSGQLAINQVINSKLVISGYYQGLTTKRTNDNGILGAGFQSASTSVFDGTIHTGNIHANWTPIQENELTIGYEFESESYGNDGKTPTGTGNFFAKAGQKSNTFYVQDLIRLLDSKLQLAGGFRIQQYSLERPTFSLVNAPYTNLVLDNPPTAYTFDGSASYFISQSGTKFRAHVGNGYRVPSLYERMGTFFTTFGGARFVPIGAPDLKPEKTIAVDAGIEQNLMQNRVRLSATYFYTKLTDVIGYGTLPQPDPFGRLNSQSGGGYKNQKGGIARGGEFSATVKPTGSTDIFTSYTYTNSDQRSPQVTGNQNIKTLGIPEQQFTLVATQRFKRFWVNFDFLATNSYLAPIFSNTSFRTYVYRFAGNRKGDLTGGYTFGFKQEKLTLRLYGTIENIFNQEYYENGFRTAKANARIGMAFGF